MDDLILQGIEHFNAARFEQALRSFRAAIAAGRGVPEARVFIGHVSLSQGRRPEAIKAFVAAIAEFPRHLPAYDGLANVLLLQSPARDLAAEKVLLGVLALKPGDDAFRARLSESLRACGQALRAVGELAAAEKALSRSLLLSRGDKPARRRLIGVLRARAEAWLATGEPAKAERELRKVLDYSPEDAAARRALVLLLRRRGLAHVARGRLRAAEAALRRALTLAPADEKSRRQKAAVALQRRRAEAARRKDARLKKADRVRRLRGRGGALVTQGRLTLAEAAFRRALLAGPGDAGAGRQLAEVLLMREQAEQSRLQARRVAKAEKIRALLEKLKAAGQAYAPAARRKLARELLARALKLDPGEARAYLLAGGVLYSSGEAARGRALIAQALRGDRGALSASDRFAALMKLGRYREALAAAESLLDGRPGLDELRAFRDPWELDDRPLADRRRELERFERALDERAGPWAPYYRADLHGPEELRHFRSLAAFPKRRYGWMLSKPGLAALCGGRFREAEKYLRGALAYKTHDWRTRGFLAEALLCLGRPEAAFAQMDRALTEAPKDEAGQVVAWRGALDLWLGRYEDAVRRFDSALALGAPYALSWKGAALLKLGREAEALALLDRALKLYPRDLEAYVWRGEAHRRLGRHRAALKDLAEPALTAPDRATPIWLWALVNRALVKAALGDRAGLKADFELIPAYVRDYIVLKTGHAEMEKILEAGLELSRGYRREEYRQAIWMT